MADAEAEPTIKQLVEQLRKATELSKDLPHPYRSIDRELNVLYEKVKRAERRRPGSSSKIGGQ
jgi:hypothetical protein